ncbi:MAG: type III pantothenate kinase [bacterium]|nr:type III pantothenate kinase [bacterium]MDW8164490.1 type III pantothenate kinase [Candidatus Omnitrophota bacterium]
MNLAIDIGNKRIKVGLFKKNRIYRFLYFMNSDIENFLFPLEWKNFKIDRCGICSVVPQLNPLIEKKIKETFKIDPLFLTYKICGIKLKIKNPKKVGIDRIVNCKGALEIFGYPVIVIDIGTAVTIDIVDENKFFIGGFILPGPDLWINSLKNTALIKEIKRKKSKVIGKDTSSAINLGFEYGIVGAIEKIVNIVREKFGIEKIILTGGYCKKLSKLLNFEKKIRKNLTLEGINIILNEN